MFCHFPINHTLSTQWKIIQYFSAHLQECTAFRDVLKISTLDHLFTVIVQLVKYYMSHYIFVLLNGISRMLLLKFLANNFTPKYFHIKYCTLISQYKIPVLYIVYYHMLHEIERISISLQQLVLFLYDLPSKNIVFERS